CGAHLLGIGPHPGVDSFRARGGRPFLHRRHLHTAGRCQLSQVPHAASLVTRYRLSTSTPRGCAIRDATRSEGVRPCSLRSAAYVYRAHRLMPVDTSRSAMATPALRMTARSARGSHVQDRAVDMTSC